MNNPDPGVETRSRDLPDCQPRHGPPDLVESRGSDYNPLLNGCLYCPLPTDKDNPLNEDVVDKIREYRVEYTQPTSFYADSDTCVVTTDYGLGVGTCCSYY